MKKLLFVAVLVIAATQSSIAQVKEKEMKAVSCPKFYLGISTGFNNPTGIIGPHIDIPINDFSISTGIGLSTWGLKLAAEGRYYFRPCNKGWAVGAGITHSTGLGRYNGEVVLSSGLKSKLDIELKPVTNAMLSVYHFWKIGRQNRFHLQMGYSARLTNDVYEVKTLGTSGKPFSLSDDQDRAFNILAPRGFIASLGFSFAL